MRINRPPCSEGDREQVSVFEDDPLDAEDFSVESTAIIHTLRPLSSSSSTREDGEDGQDVERDTIFHCKNNDVICDNDSLSLMTEDTFDLDVIKLASVDEVANMALLKERRKRRLPFVCRIGYIFLIHTVLLTFLTAATKAIVQQQQQQNAAAAAAAADVDPLATYVHSLSDPDTFLDESSPQSQALQWIRMNYVPDDLVSNNKTPYLLQHYVLAVLYYGLDGPNSWMRTDRWLWNETSVCEWYTSTYHHHSHQPSLSHTYNHNEEKNNIFVSDESTLCNDRGLLQILDLSSNRLVGTLPTEIGLLSNHLKRINLQHNDLHGTIPTELSQLSGLHYLGLDHNALEGDIPSSLGELGQLTDLILHSNHLEGSIPEELCTLLKQNDDTWEDYTDVEKDFMTIMADCLSGRVSCDCACECV